MSNILCDLIDQQGWCVADFATASDANFIGANCFIGPAELVHSLNGILAQSEEVTVVAKIIGGFCGTAPAHVAAITPALEATPQRPFDEVAMTTVLGTAWADVGINSAGGDDRRGWFRRCSSS